MRTTSQRFKQRVGASARVSKSFTGIKQPVMIHHLMERLWAYVITHNPELMERLTEDNEVTLYLESKVNAVIPKMERLFAEGRPEYVIAELCLNDLTEDL